MDSLAYRQDGHGTGEQKEAEGGTGESRFNQIQLIHHMRPKPLCCELLMLVLFACLSGRLWRSGGAEGRSGVSRTIPHSSHKMCTASTHFSYWLLL